MYDRSVIASDGPSAALAWRPQLFGGRNPRQVDDPLIEPYWNGPRVLALVDRGRVALRDLDGELVEDFAEIADGLAGASRAATLIVEGCLSHEPVQDLTAIAARNEFEPPRPGAAMTQLLVGSLGRRARYEIDPLELANRPSPATDADVAFVAVDLLWLDDQPLLDVPLLERKRLLEAVLEESQLVRLGIHVRPPIDSWLGSWRQLGFSQLAYKAANSRYHPGRPNPDWALARLPAR